MARKPKVNWERIRACERKRRYEDEDQALTAVASVIARTGHGSVIQYRCAFCSGWHVGHMPGTGVDQGSEVQVGRPAARVTAHG